MKLHVMSGMKSLHYAAKGGRTRLLQTLLDKKVKIEIRTPQVMSLPADCHTRAPATPKCQFKAALTSPLCCPSASNLSFVITGSNTAHLLECHGDQRKLSSCRVGLLCTLQAVRDSRMQSACFFRTEQTFLLALLRCGLLWCTLFSCS